VKTHESVASLHCEILLFKLLFAFTWCMEAASSDYAQHYWKTALQTPLVTGKQPCRHRW